MTSNNLPSAKTPTEPVLIVGRLQNFLYVCSLVLVPLAIFVLIFGYVWVVRTWAMSAGESVLESSISMTEGQMFDAGLDELDTMRTRIESFNKNGGGTPAVNERELDRIDAVVLELIDAH